MMVKEYVNEEGKRKNSNEIPKKQIFHRPKIMEEGNRNPTTTPLRTVSTKRRNKEKDNEEETVVELRTPEQSFPKRRKTEAKRHVAQSLNFDDGELSRKSGGTYPKTDFHVLTSFPMSIWKRKSRRSNRKKNVVRWARIALSMVAIHPKGNGFSARRCSVAD